MKDYFDDLLVCAIILAIFSPVFIALFRRKLWAIFAVGLLLILGSVPITIMSGLSINGLGNKFNGIEYFIGAAVAVCGILILIFSKKLAKK